MILRTVELKHFGKFSERAFDFRRGMNLVVGPNESGKSTLMEAIPAVLFGLRDKDRFKPWGRQGNSEAALALENGGRTLRIERNILTDQVTLVERDDLYQVLYQFEGKAAPQGRSSERKEYYDQLSRLFAVAEESIFRASLFVGQGALELADRGLASRLKTLLSGFLEVDYDRVLESLEEDYFAITRKNPWGKDKTRDRELDEVFERIEHLQQRWIAAQEGIRELESIRKAIRELQDSIETDRREREKGERYLDRVRKHWQLKEKEGGLRRDFVRIDREAGKVGDLEQRRQELESELSKTGLPFEMPPELPVLLTEAEETRKEMVGLQSETNALQEELRKQKNPPTKAPLLISLAVLTVCLLAALLTDGLAVLAWSLFSAAVLGIWGHYFWRFNQKRTERSRLQGQNQILERRRDEARQRLERLKERFEASGLSPSPVELVRMQKNLARHQQLLEKYREVVSALGVLEKSEQLGEERAHVTRELAVLDERMERERPLADDGMLPPEELPEAEEKLQALEESIRRREKELVEFSRREAALEGELGDLQQIEDEGESLKEREILLCRRRDSLAAAIELLSGSVEEFRSNYLNRFAEEVGNRLGMVTGGRYRKVRLDDDFSLQVQVREREWRPIEQFSRGTNDAAYFAVRLALTSHLSQGLNLPLLLDDPLVNQDQERLGETLKVLERLSSEHQIILFSHDDRLLKKAARERWHVVTLNDQPNVTFPAAQERKEDAQQLSFL
ncbi:MAG: AAA family ATPase [Syntrophotaleaceae bacterium]